MSCLKFEKGSSSRMPEKTHFGFFPLKNRCNRYKSIRESLFPGIEFEICSCAIDLSNGKGDMKCALNQTLSRMMINF